MHASKHLQLQISELKHAHLQHLGLFSSSNLTKDDNGLGLDRIEQLSTRQQISC
jgi:hypothetical protein